MIRPTMPGTLRRIALSATTFAFALPVMLVASASLSTVATAQAGPSVPPVIRMPRTGPAVSGPRLGMSWLGREERDSLAGHDVELGAETAQIGWEFEHSWTGRSTAPNVRLTFLAGGLERGEFLPTVSALVGMRSRAGIGLAVGPQYTTETVGIEGVLEYVWRLEDRAIPVSVRYSGTANGPRLTFLLGFSID